MQKRDVLLQKWRRRDNPSFSLSLVRTFPLHILRVFSLNHSICPASVLSDIIASTESGRACRAYACTLGNDEEGPSPRASRPFSLTSSRTPSTQPRNADFLVAIAPYFLLLSFSALSLSLSLSSILRECALFTACARANLFFLFPHTVYASSTTSCADGFAFRLRNEAKHPTRDTCKMAEFNGKVPSCAIRRSRSVGKPRRSTDPHRSYPSSFRNWKNCLLIPQLLIIFR